VNAARWIRIAAADAVPPREGRAVDLGSHQIALFNLGDRFLAVDNRCPHRGGPLADGILAGNAVVCPLHAWKVCLVTGAVQRPGDAAECLATYPTRVESDVVWVAVPESAAAGQA
jgi:nitrite reductase (NADH) small subunit